MNNTRYINEPTPQTTSMLAQTLLHKDAAPSSEHCNAHTLVRSARYHRTSTFWQHTVPAINRLTAASSPPLS
jgi:hypothetical protein